MQNPSETYLITELNNCADLGVNPWQRLPRRRHPSSPSRPVGHEISDVLERRVDKGKEEWRGRRQAGLPLIEATISAFFWYHAYLRHLYAWRVCLSPIGHTVAHVCHTYIRCMAKVCRRALGIQLPYDFLFFYFLFIYFLFGVLQFDFRSSLRFLSLNRHGV